MLAWRVPPHGGRGRYGRVRLALPARCPGPRLVVVHLVDLDEGLRSGCPGCYRFESFGEGREGRDSCAFGHKTLAVNRL
jgi:hypothetical protein